MRIESITINSSSCPSNHFCPVINMCPSGAIEQEDAYSTPVINNEKCTLCQKCLKACPYRAFETQKYN